MLSVAIAVAASNCSTDSTPPTQELTLQQKVASAKIVPGTIANSDLERASIYMDIPSKGGYLVFKIANNDEKDQIMELVYQRFKKEFDASKEQNLKDKNLEGSRVKNIACGDWAPIGPDPNDRVYRWCCNLSTGSCARQTCDCGYCC